MIKTDKNRDRRGLHERAVSAAMLLINNQQHTPPALDEVARSMGEPIAKLQTQFADGRALLIAGIEQALIFLIDSCTKAVVQIDPKDPIAQFQDLGDTFLVWAVSHPTEFRLMYDSSIIDARNEPTLRRYTDSLADLMLRMLARARDTGRLHPRENIEMLSFSSRCFIVGLASMVLDGRMQEWAPDRDPVDAAKILTADFARRMGRSSQPLPADQ